jgi:hypothetical protein
MRAKPNSSLISSLALGLLLVATAGVASGQTWPPPPASIKGELAFSETITFDYDRDGTPDRVQFWIELQGKPATGEPGAIGAEEESGSVSYFVLDLERNERIDDWLLGFNMAGGGGGFPVAGQPYPLTNIRIDGRTATFELQGSKWTITDGGDSWDKDTIEIESGGRKREGKFYGGNVTVTPDPQTVWEPVDIAENRRCNRCHEEAAISMAAEGGPHAELECAACHVEHPPKAPGTFPQCLECHYAHDDSMAAASCVSCHSSHNVDVVQYAITVPDAHCTACHQEAAATLQASGTLHMGLDCVVCHQAEHGAIPTCVYCHGAPHPENMMARPERCVRCHVGAHETKVGR